MTRTKPFLPQEAVRTIRVGQFLDGTKAVRELSLPQTPVEEAVKRAVGWFQQNGYLS